MRAELERLLTASEQWDGRSGVLQVTDAVGGVVRVRIVVSAPNAGALFDLRCAVREGMVNWVRRTGGVVPIQRIEPAATPPEPDDRPAEDDEAARVAAPGLFSGSAEADQRARDLDDRSAESNGELVRSSGRG